MNAKSQTMNGKVTNYECEYHTLLIPSCKQWMRKFQTSMWQAMNAIWQTMNAIWQTINAIRQTMND